MAKKLTQVAGFLLLFTFLFSLNPPPAVHAGPFGISTKQEIDMGRDVAKELEKKYGLVDDAALQARVSAIGAKLVAVSDRQDLPYTFKVLNTKEVNALAIPGGYIYIFKGLTDYMQSDDELAGVLGHELGHIVKRHTVHQMEKSMEASLVMAILFGDRGMPLQNLAYGALMAGYSRSDESEADHLGFLHSYKAGYNPYSMLMGLEKLEELDNKGSYGWFSSHPEPDARVSRVKGYMNDMKVLPGVTEAADYAQVVEGNWSLPKIYAKYQGYKPRYRAYFTAGTLYRIGQLPDLSPDKFILDTDGTMVVVYYDDIAVANLTADDSAAANLPLMDLAALYQTKLREWVALRIK